MDKIISLLFVFYFIGFIIKILKGDQKKRRQPPTMPPYPFPPHPHGPLPKSPQQRIPTGKPTGTPQGIPKGTQGPPSIPEIHRQKEAMEILKRWEQIAKPKLSKPEKKIELKITKPQPFAQKRVIKKEKELEKPTISPKPLFFVHPELLQQAVIMAEILGPPLVKRNPFLAPHQR